MVNLRKPDPMMPAIKTAGAYLVAGFLWVLFSDRILASMVGSPELLSRLQTFKGWSFILVTGVLLYLLVNRYFRRVEASQDALAEKNRMLATLFSNLPGMAYRCANDRDWTMEFVSEGCAALTGYQPADLVRNRTMSYAELIHPDDRDMVWKKVQAAVEEGEAFQIVYRIRDRSGDERWVWEKGRGVPVAGSDIKALEGFISDISDLKQLETQFHQSQKLEAVGRLAGSVAHDFNNILTAIGGYGVLLAERMAGNEAALRDLAEIQKATKKGGSLTRQLLAFSRKQELKPQILDLNLVASDMENMIGQLLGRNIRIEVKVGREPSWIRADRGQIEQILMNLAVNARDAMPRGGILTIESAHRHLKTPVAEDLVLTPGRYEVLEVRDTGTGMDEETLARVFEPYFTTKDREKGTGLGLAIVYGIVRQSGAHIRVVSRRGRGTTFTMFFPSSDPPANREASDDREASPFGGDERLLVVERDEELRSLLRRSLEARGYRVWAAAGADGADRMLEADPSLDLVILDYAAGPAANRLLQRIRTGPAPIRLLVLVSEGPVTGPGGEWPDNAAVLKKPFSPSDLLRETRALLDAPESPGSADRAFGS